MHATELIIGKYIHRLPKDADENALLTQLMDAVQAGGGVVDLPTSRPQSTVAVLISPGVPVFVERTLIPDDRDIDDSTGAAEYSDDFLEASSL